MMRTSRWLIPVVALVPGAAFAAPRAHGRIAVVGPAGSALARDLATELSSAGAVTELQLSPPPQAPSLEPAKACIAEAHQLAFRLDFAGALKGLGECGERFGAVLARPEAVAVASSFYTELGAAAVGAGDKDRAKAAFTRLARTPEAVVPDPSLYPPEVVAAWEDAKKSLEPARPIGVDVSPPWAVVYVDGQRVESGERLSLASGAVAAFAEAPGFAPWSGTLTVAPDTTRVAVKLAPLDADARRAAVRTAAAALPLASPGVAEELAVAFGAPVVVVPAAAKVAEAALVVPGDAGHAPAEVVGRFRPPAAANAPHAIAVAVVNKLFPQDHGPDPIGPTGPTGPTGIIVGAGSNHSTLYVVGGSVLGVLAVGATVYAVSNSQHTSPGPKNGSVVWQP